MAGIKEISELLKGLELVAVQAKKVLADGKVNALDLPVLMELIAKVDVLASAVKGVEQIPAEAKDINLDEAKELVAAVLALVAAVKAA